MKTLTKSEAISNHRKLYHWIATETRKQKRKVHKSEYFDFYNVPDTDIPQNYCYCCEYDEQQLSGACFHCPIDWGNEKCGVAGSLFKQWHACNDKDWKRAADLADKIAELPERIFIGEDEKLPEIKGERAKFTIAIEERVVEEFEVEAQTPERAMQIAEQKYKDGVFVLENGEVQTRQMAIVKPEIAETNWVEF